MNRFLTRTSTVQYQDRIALDVSWDDTPTAQPTERHKWRRTRTSREDGDHWEQRRGIRKGKTQSFSQTSGRNYGPSSHAFGSARSRRSASLSQDTDSRASFKTPHTARPSRILKRKFPDRQPCQDHASRLESPEDKEKVSVETYQSTNALYSQEAPPLDREHAAAGRGSKNSDDDESCRGLITSALFPPSSDAVSIRNQSTTSSLSPETTNLRLRLPEPRFSDSASFNLEPISPCESALDPQMFDAFLDACIEKTQVLLVAGERALEATAEVAAAVEEIEERWARSERYEGTYPRLYAPHSAADNVLTNFGTALVDAKVERQGHDVMIDHEIRRRREGQERVLNGEDAVKKEIVVVEG